MMRSRFIPALCSVFATLLILNGCATPPDKIAPQYVSEIQYINLTCDQMAAEQSRLLTALAEASRAQHQARGDDALGVLLIGVPTSSLSGSNQASYVARLKGELEALQRAAIKNNCTLAQVTALDAVNAGLAKDAAIMQEFREQKRRETPIGWDWRN